MSDNQHTYVCTVQGSVIHSAPLLRPLASNVLNGFFKTIIAPLDAGDSAISKNGIFLNLTKNE